MDPTLVTTVAAVPVMATVGAETSVRYVLYIDVEHSEAGTRPTRTELLSLLWRGAAGIAESVRSLDLIEADDEPLLATKSATRDRATINVPGPDEWGGPLRLRDFSWLQILFSDLVRLEYPAVDMPVVANDDELQFRSPT